MTMSSLVSSLVTCENLCFILATLAIGRFLQWIFIRKRFVDTINRIPGLPLDQLHPFLGHVDTLLASRGSIPGMPLIADSVTWYLHPERIPKFAAQHGIFRIWMFHPFYCFPFAIPYVIVLDPDLIRQLLVSEKTDAGKKLIKDPISYAAAKPLIGDSFLSLPDGPVWKHQRKTTALAFRQDLLENICTTVYNLLETFIFPKLDKNPHIEGLEWSARLTTEVLGLVAFSHSFGSLQDSSKQLASPPLDPHHYQSANTTSCQQAAADDKDESLYDTFTTILSIITTRLYSHPLANYLKFAENRRFNKACRKLNGVIEKIIKARLSLEEESPTKEGSPRSQENGMDKEASPSPSTPPNGRRSMIRNNKSSMKERDILSHLMVPDENGTRLDYAALHGNVRMLFFAGHDTTAVTVAWALWELAMHPEIQKQLQAEIDTLFPDAPNPINPSSMEKIPQPPPSYSQISQLKYLDAVMKETLRIHAPAVVARTPTEDIHLERGDATRYTIPAGATIFVMPKYTQVQAAYVKEQPAAFRPERFFMNGPEEEAESMRAYMPFSIGSRDCVGRPMAIAEVKAVLVHVLRRYSIRPNNKAIAPMPVSLLTFKPHQVLVDLHRR